MDGLFSRVSCISTTLVFLDLRHCFFLYCVLVSQLGQAVPTDLLTISCILNPAMCLCVGPHFWPAASVVYVSLITFTKERKDQKKIERYFKYLSFGGLVNQLGIQVCIVSSPWPFMVIQWVCNSKSLGCSLPPSIFVINGRCIRSWFYLSLKIRMFPTIMPWVIFILFYFIFCTIDWCVKRLCVPWIQVSSLSFSWQPEPQPVVLTCFRGISSEGHRRAPAGFCWGWEQSPLGPRFSASPWLCVPNKSKC